MLICPSCGSSVQGDLRLGCPSCGARAVGPPLARAEYYLPSFGRASLACAIGLATMATFVGSLIGVLIEQKPSRYGFWTYVTAGEVAAWRLKWAALPVSIAVLWISGRIISSIKRSPSQFIGLRAAQFGLTSAVIVTMLIATLIGITVPERLRQRQDAIDAAKKARGYALHRALIEYRELHGTYPTDREHWIDALRTLPDPDGSIADALRFVDAGGYDAGAKLAVGPSKVKPLLSRGVALRSVSVVTNPEPAGLSFTSYTLRIPSEHRLFASDDDFIMSDGVIQRAPGSDSSSSVLTRKP